MATTLALPVGRDGGDALVEVAVDAPAGPGPRTYTYLVPAALGDLEPGEPVLVPFGRAGGRRSGSSSGRARRRRRAAARELRPVAARVRSDGPLLPPLAAALRRVDRRPLPRPAGDGDPGDAAAGDARAARAGRRGHAGRRGAARPADPGLDARRTSTCSTSWPAGRGRCATSRRPEGRAGLLRRLRALADDGPRRARPGRCSGRRSGRATSAGCGSRRRGRGRGRALAGRGAPAGATARAAPASPRWPSSREPVGGTGRRAGVGPAADGVPAAPLAERHGASAIAGLVRRGLAPGRGPRAAAAAAGRPARRPPRRPAGRLGADRRPGGRPRDRLRGDRARATRRRSCSTASPAAARPRSTSRRSPPASRPGGPRCCSSRRSRSRRPIVDRLRADLPVRVALLHSGLGEGERADEWRRIRAGDADLVVGTRIALARAARRRRPGRSSTRSTTPPTRATGRRGSRRATPRIELARLAGAAVVLGSATPSVESMGHARAGRYRRAVLPVAAGGHRAHR